MSFSFRVSIMLVLVFTVSLALTAALSYVKFEKTVAGVIISRHQATLRSLADNIEAGLNLGLSLGEIQNYDTLVDGAGDKQPDLLGAEVLDGARRSLFTHARAGTKPTDPSQPPISSSPSSEAAWTTIGARTITLGTPLLNSFGQTAGFLVVSFSRAAYDRPVYDIGRFMIRCFLVIEAIGSAAAVVVGLLLVRPFNLSLDQIEVNLRGAGGAKMNIVRIQEMTAPIEAEIRSIDRSIP